MTAQSPSIFLATPCYGGLAHATYMRSLLALRAACAARGVALRVELGGGEALIGRGRAAMMAAFLASPATHLLFVDNDIGFTPDAVFRLLDSGRDVVGATACDAETRLPNDEPSPDGFRRVASVGAGFLLISRAAARRLAGAYPELNARLGDLQAARAATAAMVFDPLIEPSTGRYLTDQEAFCHRWRALGGDVWADPHPIGVAVSPA